MVLVAKSKSRTNTAHKKRAGSHHRLTKHYTKHYYPYIPLVLIVGLGLMLNVVWGKAGSNVLGSETSISVNNLLVDTNAQRHADNESNLQPDNLLTQAAQAKADDMAARNYWSHNTPDGRTPWSFITDSGYKFQSAGENLAYGFNDSSDTLSAWMSSPGHRANILNADYSEVGFGVANSSNFMGTGPETVVVAMYGDPKSTSTTFINNESQSQGVLSDTVSANENGSQSVSRITVLSQNSAAVMFALAVFATCGLLWLVTRHTLAWRRVVVQGEEFILRHRMFDVIIVSVATLCTLLSHTAGFIH